MFDLLQSLVFDPMRFEFMQRAMIGALLIGTICAIFSCFLIVKGWSLVGDAVSHAVLPGLALAYIGGVPLIVGAFLAGLLCAVGTGFIASRSRVKQDAVLGILFSGMFAFGLVLLTKIHTDIHLMHVLFGNILGITSQELLHIAMIACPIVIVFILRWKDFMLLCFDIKQAKAAGLNVQLLNYLMLILLSLTIVASIKAAGIILVIAMLIAPGATAFLLTSSFSKMIILSVFTSLFSCVLGVYFSFHFDGATAPIIVLTQSFLFLIAFLFSPQKGLISNVVMNKGRVYAKAD